MMIGPQVFSPLFRDWDYQSDAFGIEKPDEMTTLTRV